MNISKFNAYEIYCKLLIAFYLLMNLNIASHYYNYQKGYSQLAQNDIFKILKNETTNEGPN